jgi:hypothetical protein
LFYGAIKRVRFVCILNYVSYVKAEAMRVIGDELGWVYYGGKHYESIYTRFFQSYILPRKFGFDKRRGHLSTLICSGQLTREEALAEMGREICPEEIMAEDRQFVLKKLGLGDAEFEAMMKAPARRFGDYPSYEKSLIIGALLRLYRSARSVKAGLGVKGVAEEVKNGSGGAVRGGVGTGGKMVADQGTGRPVAKP